MRKTVLFFLTLLLLGNSGLFAQSQKIAVTVYNQDLALVEEVRTISPTGRSAILTWKNVPARIDPTSVHVKWLQGAKSAILEQNFEYDLINATKLFRKYVGKNVGFRLKNQTELTGKLLAVGQFVVLQTADGKIVTVNPDQIVQYTFPELPEGLILRPALHWILRNPLKRSATIRVDYLTSGMNWHAEYVGVLSRDEKTLEVSGWASIENQSGTAYKNAELKLVAGQPNRVYGRKPSRYGMQLTKAMPVAEAERFSERAAFEYHLYNLNGRTTLLQNQTKQIPLFKPKAVTFHKKFVFDGQRWGKAIRVFLTFRNSPQEGIGKPLPAGKFRIYEKDSPESSIFLGEDWVNHTPVEETVTLHVGNAFDIRGKRTQTATKKIAKRALEESYSIEIKNFKDAAITVEAIEHLNYQAPRSQWEIVRASQKYSQKDSRTIVFPVHIAAHGVSTVTYTVRYEW